MPRPTLQGAQKITYELIIRDATPEDIPQIYRIKKEEFPQSWKEESFIRELNHEIAHFYVAAIPQKRQPIIGYILFWIIEEILELHDIAVSSKYHRQGVGTRLMDNMIKRAVKEGVREMFLEVRKSQRGAIHFYKKFDFEKVGERKAYYTNPLEDALVFKGYLP